MFARYAVAATLVLLIGSYADNWRGGADAAQTAVGENTALTQLRLINKSQAAYATRHGHFACTLAELGDQYGLIDRDLSDGQKDGYSFSLHCATDPSQPAYQVWATPINTHVTGNAHYCTDATGALGRARWQFDLCSGAGPIH